MENTEDLFELPVAENTNYNTWLIRCLESLNMSFHIKGGNFVIEYENVMEIYQLGMLMSAHVEENFKTSYGAPNPYYKRKNK
jgi:hypothetical protein